METGKWRTEMGRWWEAASKMALLDPHLLVIIPFECGLDLVTHF